MSAPEAAIPAAAPPPPPRRRNPWITVLLCLAIFAGGGVVGAGLMVIHVYRTAMSALLHPEVMPERIARRMQRRLDLSDAQVVQVEEILRRHQAPLLRARAELLEREGPDLDALESEVAAVLEPGQAVRWREHFGRLRRDWTSGLRPDLPDFRGR